MTATIINTWKCIGYKTGEEEEEYQTRIEYNQQEEEVQGRQEEGETCVGRGRGGVFSKKSHFSVGPA
jgi:hypothetical protein